MKIAILGTRGIPASYGGFETLAEELSWRLAERGHDVTVYCRAHYTDRSLSRYRGVRLVTLPTIRTKYLDTVMHALVASLHTAREKYDAVLYCNAITAIVCWIPRKAAGSRVVLNVDGLERNRKKWSAAGRAAYLISERLSTTIPDAIVTDAAVIRDYYRDEFGLDAAMIPYGGDLEAPARGATLHSLGLDPENYFLYVSRLEPENNALAVIEAYRPVGGNVPLVIVGAAPYAPDYIDRLHRVADSRVLFPGAIYGEGYRELLFHARACIQATEVGGTHPALVEAMGAGRVIAYNDTPENREVCGDAGIPFDARRPETLTVIFNSLLDDPARSSVLGQKARERVQARYRWEAVADAYEKILAG